MLEEAKQNFPSFFPLLGGSVTSGQKLQCRYARGKSVWGGKRGKRHSVALGWRNTLDIRRNLKHFDRMLPNWTFFNLLFNLLFNLSKKLSG